MSNSGNKAALSSPRPHPRDRELTISPSAPAQGTLTGALSARFPEDSWEKEALDLSWRESSWLHQHSQ